jgi:hypothetical protein
MKQKFNLKSLIFASLIINTVPVLGSEIYSGLLVAEETKENKILSQSSEDMKAEEFHELANILQAMLNVDLTKFTEQKIPEEKLDIFKKYMETDLDTLSYTNPDSSRDGKIEQKYRLKTDVFFTKEAIKKAYNNLYEAALKNQNEALLNSCRLGIMNKWIDIDDLIGILKKYPNEQNNSFERLIHSFAAKNIEIEKIYNLIDELAHSKREIEENFYKILFERAKTQPYDLGVTAAFFAYAMQAQSQHNLIAFLKALSRDQNIAELPFLLGYFLEDSREKILTPGGIAYFLRLFNDNDDYPSQDPAVIKYRQTELLPTFYSYIFDKFENKKIDSKTINMLACWNDSFFGIKLSNDLKNYMNQNMLDAFKKSMNKNLTDSSSINDQLKKQEDYIKSHKSDVNKTINYAPDIFFITNK